MALLKPVKVLESCKVAPPPGSVAPTSLPLTFFDLLWLVLPPPELLHFYDFPYPTTHFTHSLLPRIKHSLSLTLSHFYPFAGNLSWSLQSTKPIFHYTDGDSVSFTVAESDADFNHLSGNHARNVNESRPLVPSLQLSRAVVPVSAIQVTVFPNSGICIGITVHNAIADGKTLAHFMKSWASICRSGDASLSLESLPFFDRTLIKDPDGIEGIFLEELVKYMGSKAEFGMRSLRVVELKLPTNMVRATFELKRADIARLREWVLAGRKKDEETQPIYLSTFVLTCAYVWVCCVKAAGQVQNNMARFVITVDCRGRLDPPIPATYFGNCVRGCAMTAERSDLMREDGVGFAAKLIGEVIKGLEKGVLKGFERGVSNLLQLESRRSLAAAGSTKFGFYEANFGWGKPKKVELVSIDRTGAMFLTGSSSGDGGVEINLVLDKQEMDVFSSVFLSGLAALSPKSSL